MAIGNIHSKFGENSTCSFGNAPDRHTDMLEFGLVNTKKLKVAHTGLPSVGFRS